MWQEEGWVVCRVFKKKIATSSMRRVSEHESPCWYDDQVSFMPELESPKHNSTTNVVVSSNLANYQLLPYPNCKKEQLDHHHHHHLPYQLLPHEHFLPLLESPKVLLQSAAASTSSSLVLNHNAAALQSSISLRSSQEDHDQRMQQSHDDHQNFHALVYGNNNSTTTTTTTNDHQQPAGMDDHDQLTDWRVLDKFVASQLSNEDHHHVISKENVIVRHWEKQEMVPDQNASTSTSASCQIELWK